MHLTPEILAATYEWLRALPPFRRWKLPPADEVEFHVIRSQEPYSEYYADCDVTKKMMRIRLSSSKISHTAVLARYMAHEMCHMHANRRGEKKDHGPLWLKSAAQVCKEHGFDPKEF